jgi:hypothetical protein
MPMLSTSPPPSYAPTMQSNDFPQPFSSNSLAEFNAMVFPPVGEVIKLIKAEKPGQGFNELEQTDLTLARGCSIRNQ